jgi:uncharacterized protein
MATDLSAVQTKIRPKLPFLREKYFVEKIGVFGSVARGDNTDKSDVDLLVNLEKPIGLFTFINLENYLAEILGKRVDLVTPKALKPIVKDDILNEVVYV